MRRIGILILRGEHDTGRSKPAWKGWLIASAVAASFFMPALPSQSGSDEQTKVVYLTRIKGSDGTFREWSEQERQEFYHTPEGNRLMPYDWFLALEQRGKVDPFIADDHVSRFRFIPDLRDPGNPDKLPVGFTREEVNEGFQEFEFFSCDVKDPADPTISRKLFPAQLGFNCAACHTGQIQYKGQILRIDGGPSMANNLGFMKALVSALEETFRDSKKFERFAQKVLAKEGGKGLSAGGLRACVNKYLDVANGPRRVAEGKGMSLYPIDWGFGRLDALGRGGNTLLMKLDPDNIRAATAPVSIPHIWEAWKMNWVQWNGAIQNLEARYLIQALALNAGVRLTGSERDRFATTVNWGSMDKLAQQFRELAPPRWPAGIFDQHKSKEEKEMQRQRAVRGQEQYGRFCAGCHSPTEHSKVQYGKQMIDRYEVKMIALEEIGTDPAAAYNFFARTVMTGPLGSTQGGSLPDTIAATKAAQYFTTEIMKKQNRPGWEQNPWRALPAYIARRQAGVWATAPFLHNGSVPNLYELLTAVEERSKSFCVGSLEFNPERVGFSTDTCAEGEIPFDTTLPGNSNAGHEFRNDDRDGHAFTASDCEALRKHSRNGILGCELSENDRWGIIEYMKSL